MCLWCYWWRFDFFGQRLFFDPEDMMRYFQLAQDHWYHSVIHTEYPPLAILIFYWPLYFTKNLFYYSQILSIQCIVAYVLTIYFTYKLYSIYSRVVKNKLWLLILLPSAFYFALNRFDIFPVLFVLLTLFFLHTQKFITAIIFLSIAILFKLYPLLLLPMVVVYIYKFAGKKIMYKSLCYMGLLLGGVYIFYGFMFGTHAVLQPFFTYISRSDFYGSWLWVYNNFYNGIDNIIILNKAVMLVGFALLYSGWFYGFTKNKNTSLLYVFGGVTIILIWYHIFTSFYSPQWWLWYLPFLIFLIENWRDAGLILVYDILNYIQFPLLFNIDPNTTILVFTVSIRTILLVFIGLIIVKRFWQLQIKKNYVLDYSSHV
jgi:hypothetical protein